MKKCFASITVCFFTLIFAGCLKDTFKKTYTYTYYTPVYKTTADVRANIKSNSSQPIQNPGKIYIKGQYILLNEIDRGIHIIDNSDPSHPKNIAFIDIPGNMDMAIKNNTLYADLYTDLVAIDITDLNHVQLMKVVESIFPQRYYSGVRPDSTKIIASWEKRDTTIIENRGVSALSKSGFVYTFGGLAYSPGPSAMAASASPYGVGGSMARFTITNERLYTAGTQNLDVFNIVNANDPVDVARKTLGWSIETIYPFADKLFIGSQTGMFIYNVSNPDNPVEEGTFNHAKSCDPVISDGQFAYVTLRSGTPCQATGNELDILKLNGVFNTPLIRIYAMTNPHGLAKDGNILFICDGKDGLKIYDASDVNNLKLITQIPAIGTSDVIAFNGNALVVATDGLYQFDYSDTKNIRLRSKINLN